MREATFFNFAYGSNMPTLRIQERCASARVVGVAKLLDYELRWHKPSRDGSGKCDVVPCHDATAVVFGVLYEIANSERTILDKAEQGYSATSIDVIFNGNAKKAIVYRADNPDSARQPYSWYKELVVLGAKEHGLPREYISALDQVTAKIDDSGERNQKNAEIITRVSADVARKLEAMLG
jgi:gamma-glutamylcyclotransferase